MNDLFIYVDKFINLIWVRTHSVVLDTRLNVMRSDLVKRFAVGSTTTTLATAGTADIAVTLPIDVTAGLGIQIWAWQIEIVSPTLDWEDADDRRIHFMLSRDAVSAVAYINNTSIIDKIVMRGHTGAAAGSGGPINMVFGKELYPAVPYFSNTIHFAVTNVTGVDITAIYCRLWYSVIQVTQAEMLGLLANAGVA